MKWFRSIGIRQVGGVIAFVIACIFSPPDHRVGPRLAWSNPNPPFRARMLRNPGLRLVAENGTVDESAAKRLLPDNRISPKIACSPLPTKKDEFIQGKQGLALT